MRRVFCAATIVLALFGCSGGSSSGGDSEPPPPPPPASCLPTISTCTEQADCCATCFYGYCMPSIAGGKCVTTDDCQEPNLCVSGVCAAATCRQDLDVCTADVQCCAGNCRGSGSCGANRPPVADLGLDATFDKGVTVWLGGIGVGDPDGDTLTYAWSLTRPAGSAAALSSTTSSNPSLRPDVVGPYTVSVTVSDGQYTASDTAVLTAVNSAPVARVTAVASAPRNVLVALDATTSTDVNGDALTFSWTLAGPGGSSAALSSTTGPRPTFIPDVLGDYVVTLLASDGELASPPASVAITATNSAPVARVTGIGALNAGESVTLSAETSTDENGDPLTFTWSFSGPAGTAAFLSSTAGSTTTLTTDKAGSYTVTVVASDGIATHSAYRYVVAQGHVWKLPHDVVAAAYARATDRLILVSVAPVHALWILDPSLEVEQRVDLAQGPPLSVAVSADGLAAVVGRNGGITQVDLANGTVLGDCVTQWSDGIASWNYDAASVAVGPPLDKGTKQEPRITRFAYAAPGSAENRGPYTMGLDLGTCSQSADWFLSIYGTITAAMRPGASSFYVRDGGAGSAFYIYPVETGPLVTRIWAEPADSYGTGPGFWFTDDGNRMVVEVGDVYDPNPGASAYLQKPLTRLGALGNPTWEIPPVRVLHADHSSVLERISIVPMNEGSETTTDTVLKRYFAYASSPASYPPDGAPTPLPTLVIDGGLNAAHGRWVFYRSDGSARYAIVQTAPGAPSTLFAVAPLPP